MNYPIVYYYRLFYTILYYTNMLYSTILYDFILYCTALCFIIIILYHSFIWLSRLSFKRDYSLLARTMTRTCRILLCVSFANNGLKRSIYIYTHKQVTHFWKALYSNHARGIRIEANKVGANKIIRQQIKTTSNSSNHVRINSI